MVSDAMQMLSEIRSMRIADEFRYLKLQQKSMKALFTVDNLRERRIVKWKLLCRSVKKSKEGDDAKKIVFGIMKKSKIIEAWRQYSDYIRNEMHNHMKAIAHRSQYIQKLGWLVLKSHRDNRLVNRHHRLVLKFKSLKALYDYRDRAYSLRDQSSVFNMTREHTLMKKIMGIWREASAAANYDTSLKCQAFYKWKDHAYRSIQSQRQTVVLFKLNRSFSHWHSYQQSRINQRQREAYLRVRVSDYWTMNKWQRLHKSFSIWRVTAVEQQDSRSKAVKAAQFRQTRLKSSVMQMLKMAIVYDIADRVYDAALMKKMIVLMCRNRKMANMMIVKADSSRMDRLRRLGFYGLKRMVELVKRKVEKFEYLRLTKKCLRYLDRAVAIRNGKIARMMVLRNGITLLKCFCSFVQNTNKKLDRSAIIRGISISSPESCLFSSSNILPRHIPLNY